MGDNCIIGLEDSGGRMERRRVWKGVQLGGVAKGEGRVQMESIGRVAWKSSSIHVLAMHTHGHVSFSLPHLR